MECNSALDYNEFVGFMQLFSYRGVETGFPDVNIGLNVLLFSLKNFENKLMLPPVTALLLQPQQTSLKLDKYYFYGYLENIVITNINLVL